MPTTTAVHRAYDILYLHRKGLQIWRRRMRVDDGLPELSKYPPSLYSRLRSLGRNSIATWYSLQAFVYLSDNGLADNGAPSLEMYPKVHEKNPTVKTEPKHDRAELEPSSSN
ncbi:hypothetical protein RvY_08313-1 [Ramazzottius varieornatus]|uniref:Uncharacterized protein n=1 Tax=Ramazzottius varieornatus TaxID=947166 RepID=A0A1D1V5D4_RAMVA|nr:hypothetical protein RvY_08313-1 [Ramazzottius varieornatus]